MYFRKKEESFLSRSGRERGLITSYDYEENVFYLSIMFDRWGRFFRRICRLWKYTYFFHDVYVLFLLVRFLVYFYGALFVNFFCEKFKDNKFLQISYCFIRYKKERREKILFVLEIFLRKNFFVFLLRNNSLRILSHVFKFLPLKIDVGINGDRLLKWNDKDSRISFFFFYL